jgi:hypothetical protein
MSLMHRTQVNGDDPYVYLKDMLEQPASRIRELLPYRWAPAAD